MTADARKAKLVLSLRRHGLSDARLLSVIETIPREIFISGLFADDAWADRALPLSCGQTISQPSIVAIMTDRLALHPRHKVLEIGTGSGYQTAVLARLCRRVYTLERYRSLLEGAEARFRELRLANITAMLGDGTKGWPAQAPFDRILVTAAAPEVPAALAQQLAMGGILVMPMDRGREGQMLCRFERRATGLMAEEVMPVRFVPLVQGLPADP